MTAAINCINRCKALLGTYVEISLSAPCHEDALLDMSTAMFAEIERIQALMSFHDPESELSYLNQSALHRPVKLSTDMHTVLSQALQLSRASHGLYDITVGTELVRRGVLPDRGYSADETGNWQDLCLSNGRISFRRAVQLDLGGIAKGYAVDCALAVLNTQKVNAVVNAGGDLRMNHWQQQHVNIRLSPARRCLHNKTAMIKLPMYNAAVATSATYYQSREGKPGVIICPQSKQPVERKQSYCVFADNCMLADALTKVAFLSTQSATLIRSMGAQALVVDSSGNVSRL